MPSWLRRCVTVACLLVAWLVARPAAASAPLCDERAASAVAPMPVLDTPNASVDVGDGERSCEGWAARDLAYQRGERPTRAFPSLRGDVVTVTLSLSVPPPSVERVVPRLAELPADSGVRFLVERPPRV